jgi:hypothetical protein
MANGTSASSSPRIQGVQTNSVGQALLKSLPQFEKLPTDEAFETPILRTGN